LNSACRGMYHEYTRVGSLQALENAISILDVVANMAGVGDAGLLNNLSVLYGSRYERTGVFEDLQEAIRKAESAVATCADHPNRAMHLNTLGNHLCSRYERTGTFEDLQEAIRQVKAAVAITPIDHLDRAMYLNSLGSFLGFRYERTGALEDLQESILHGRNAVASTPAYHPSHAGYLLNLSSHLSSRYKAKKTFEDLQEAIRHMRVAVGVTPVEHKDRGTMLNNLANFLRYRYERTGTFEDLQEAIHQGKAAVAATPVDHPGRAGILSDLSNSLYSRYKKTGIFEDLQEAICQTKVAVAVIPVDHPDRLVMLNNLGSFLKSRYDRTGAFGDLQEAIHQVKVSVATTPVDHLDRAGRLSNLSNYLTSRYESTGTFEDLQEAIRQAEAAVAATPIDHRKVENAVDATPEGHSDLASRLNNLSHKLEIRYERTGNIEDLEEAIRKAEQAIDMTPKGHPDMAGRMSNLGNKLERRYIRTGSIEDLEKAIRRAKQAVDMTPEDHPYLAARLNNLSTKLGRRHERTGSVEDLEEVISRAEQAVDAIPEGHLNLAACLFNLSNKLESRYELTGSMEDLEEAICKTRQAVNATHEGHPRLAVFLRNLSRRLGHRYKRMGNVEDLEEAIRKAGQAADVTPEGHKDLTGRPSNLGNELGYHYEPASMNNLGTGSKSRSERTGNMEDLEEAIGRPGKAVDVTPEGHQSLSIMSALPRHQYSPLAATSSYRLLRLQQNKGSEPLKGELLEYTIDQSPPYLCLSYAWGTDRAKQTIEIQGQRLPITDTVYMALEWIRAYQRDMTSDLLWIDSICINQGDMKERSEQVRHMKKIFSSAKLVLVYLGEEADGSGQIPHLYGEIHKVFRKWFKNGAHWTSEDKQDFPAHSEYESVGLPKADHPVWEANRAFLRRPWFLRTWILQEAVLAGKLLFICGDWGYDGQGLILGWHLIMNTELSYSRVSPSAAMKTDLSEGRATQQIRLMLDLGMGKEEKKSPGLVGLLERSRQGLASNPQDYIYGLLGLTSDLYRANISVDYEESVADTYRRVAKTIVDQGDGVELLYNIHGLDSELDLPSWVPDWSIRGAPFFSLAPSFRIVSTTIDVPYLCARGHRSGSHVKQEEDVLICKGYIVDMIEMITDVPTNDESDEDLLTEDRTSNDENSDERKFKPPFSFLTHCLSEMTALLNTNSAYPPEKHEEIIWRTAIWNRERSSERKAPESYVNLYEAFKSFVAHRTLPSSEIVEKEYGPRMDALDRELGFFVPNQMASAIVTQELMEEQEKAETFAQWADPICVQMRRCSTKRGYLGQVPKSAMVGDVICVIAGAAVPFTVRPNDKGYSLIGQCYLHGYMEGEALNDPDVVEKDIVLV
jgi:tetratricopeptide (TPR) repeat protein